MPGDTSEQCVAATYSDFAYLTAKIYFNLAKVADLDDAELERSVIHEFVHLLLAPIRSENNTQNTEYCVTSISRLFRGLRNASKK